MESAFARCPRWLAGALLLLLAGLIGYGLAADPFPMPPLAGSNSEKSDLALYNTVLDRVSAGETFYHATASEQRIRGYPLRPFVTVRPPWLTWLIVSVGGRANARLLFQGLVGLATLAMVIRLFGTLRSKVLVLAASLCVLSFLFVATVPIYWFEAWSAALVLLALACWSETTWGLSIAVAIAAVLLRELSAPFLGVMLVMALVEKRWREAAGWVGAMLVFAAATAWHASQVHAIATLADKTSPGWVRSGGWPYIIRMVHESSPLIITPLWVVAVLVPLSLLGWAGWHHPIARRATFYLTGFIAAFMLVGRQNTAYWGMLLSSLIVAGAAFAPHAVMTLLQRVRRAD